MVCCGFEGCKLKTAMIVGFCRYCNIDYCLKHRLPEAHYCHNQETCNNTAKTNLENKLFDEATKTK